MNFEMRFNEDEVVRQVVFNSTAMQDLIALRYNILRKPLKLQFTQEQLAAESDFFHFGFYSGDKLTACLMLVPEENNKIKMKQVAVAEEMQGKGIGKKLVMAAENFAFTTGYKKIFCHARDTAVPFYKSLGYVIIGEGFTEVGIPHHYLEKPLVNAES